MDADPREAWVDAALQAGTEIGKGTYGVVVHCRVDGHDYALKSIKGWTGDNETNAYRLLTLLADAGLLARDCFPRHHFSVKRASGDTVIVLDYVEGVSAFRWLRGAAWLTNDERLAVATRVVDTGTALLAALHGVGVVVQDVSSPNVVVRPDGGVVFLDFGQMARLCAGELSPLQTATIVTAGVVDARSRLVSRQLGTVCEYYRSFERWLAMAHGIHSNHWAASDRYALGAVAVELLTGCLPVVVDADAVETVRRTATRERALSSSWQTDVYEDVSAADVPATLQAVGSTCGVPMDVVVAILCEIYDRAWQLARGAAARLAPRADWMRLARRLVPLDRGPYCDDIGLNVRLWDLVGGGDDD
jgi:serine/threonine protein kinase